LEHASDNQMAWGRGEAVAGVARRCGELVLVLRGELAGQVAVLVELEAVEPHVAYLADTGAEAAIVGDTDIEPVHA
jgi:hypothetical protein